MVFLCLLWVVEQNFSELPYKDKKIMGIQFAIPKDKTEHLIKAIGV